MNVCAVVVTYNPDTDFGDRLRRVSCQTNGVVVVDNSPSAPERQRVELAVNDASCALIRNSANAGLGRALNQGCAWALQNGFSHVLLFDQDSTPIENMGAELTSIWRSMDSEVAILGSNFIEIRSQRTWMNTECGPDRSWQPVFTLTTSGTLLPLTTFRQLGPFCEHLFVDLVDMEYSLRAKSQRVPYGVTYKVLMSHEVGRMSRKNLIGRTVWPANHAATRRYFMARNLVILLKRYGRYDLDWACRAVVGLIKSLMLVGLFEDHRLSKFQQTARGLKDGVLWNLMKDPCVNSDFYQDALPGRQG